MKAAAKKTTTACVYTWTDDPGAGANPGGGVRIKRPVPKLGNAPFGLAITNPKTAPAAKLYAAGTAGFRYWTAAEALRRAADFWGGVLPGVNWEPGTTLPVDLDHAVDLNAFYDRVGLRFFHDTVSGTTVYSGESPDVAAHELGHAILDSIKPALWDAMSMEIGSFHESFGDMSALLTALQLAEVRTQVLADTGGAIERASRWSRLAEQLGWAIRLVAPDAVDSDCLRNAANRFSYQNPATLPRTAPATRLCREVHSFSRVFTGAALDCLAGMLRARPTADSANLLTVSKDFAAILAAGIQASPVVTGFYAQVASHAVAAADRLFPGSGYSAALKAGFMKHAILSPAAVAAVAGASTRELAVAVAPDSTAPALESVDVRDYGLGVKDLYMVTAGQKARFRSAAAAVPSVESSEGSAVDAAKAYLEDLISSGKIRSAGGATREMAGAPQPKSAWRVTHEIRTEGKKSVVRRLRVSCGLYQCACGAHAVA